MVKIEKRIASWAIAQESSAGSAESFTDDADRRLRIVQVPEPPLASLRWEKRPRPEGGNPSWTYVVDGPQHRFAVVVGHIENGSAYPFEVWVMGEPPRGLTAIARSLSMDMRSRDRGWLQRKLDSLAECPGEPFDLAMPDGLKVRAESDVAAFARLVRYRCEQLGAFADMSATPVLDALVCKREPKTRAEGGLAWYVDVSNAATGDNFTMFVKEAVLPDGQRRPLSVWLAGRYPRSLDGLCKSLSLDFQVVEMEWSLRKLGQLRGVEEPNGGFMAQVPGSEKSTWFPSTVAYLAALLQHRCHVLGLADGQGKALGATGVISLAQVRSERAETAGEAAPKGELCGDCGAYALTRASGCDLCTACGASRC